MKLLSLFYLLSTFAVAESACTRKAPRREGFLRHKCVPGFYEGSCLIILEKLQFHDAMETCRYDYGGRLATAPTKEAIQLWSRTIHFDAKTTVKENTRFWVGLGYSPSTAKNGNFGFKYDEPDKEMQKFINLTMWNRVFGKPRTSAQIEWERYADKDSLEYSDCPEYGVVFNPNNMKFDVQRYVNEHYALCETTRWAKLQCDEEWHLIPQLRMCLKVHYTYTNFLIAHDTCRDEKSFIAVAQNKREIEMFRAVIVPYGRPPKNNVFKWNSTYSMASFWTGTKFFNHTSFSLDGTKSVYSAEDKAAYCETITYEDYMHNGVPRVGITISCTDFHLPYMCQRFADQSLIKNV